jgi:hypothetical protein
MAEDQKQPSEANEAQPGQVIVPGSQQESTAPPATAAPFQQITPYEDTLPHSTAVQDSSSVSWTASEFISHEKSPGWYLNLLVATFALAAFIYFITRDLVSPGVIVFGAIMFGFYASRKPRELAFKIDQGGVQIGDKYHSYDEFRTFSVVPEGAFSSIVFVPLKRFAPLISIYYAPADEEKIVNILTSYLAYEERKHDPIDNLMQRIRF